MTKTVPSIKRWNGRADRQTLRALRAFLADQEGIDHATLEPTEYEPRVLRAKLTSGSINRPSPIPLEIYWFDTGEFSIRCFEQTSDQKEVLYRCLSDPVSEDIEISDSVGSDEPRTTTFSIPPDHPNRVNRHPMQIVTYVLGTVGEQ